MKIQLVYRNGVFIPAYDEDYEKAKRFKHGSVVNCDVKLLRNPELNKKYHALINKAWNCLNERQVSLFGEHGREAFRKSLEVMVGFFEPIYDFKKNETRKAPRSTAFDAMGEDEFEELYSGVYDAIHVLLTRKTISEQEFQAIFEGF